MATSVIGPAPHILRNFKLYNESTGMYLVAGTDGIAMLTPVDPLISGRGVFYYYPDWAHMALLAQVDAAAGQPQFIRLSTQGFLPQITMTVPDAAAPHRVNLYFNGKLLSNDALTTTDAAPRDTDAYTLTWASSVFFLMNGHMYLAMDQKTQAFSMTTDRNNAQEFEFFNNNIILHMSYQHAPTVPWRQWTVQRLVLGPSMAGVAVQTVAVSHLVPGNPYYARYVGKLTQLCFGGKCGTLTVPAGGKLQTAVGTGNEDTTLTVVPFFPTISRRHTIVAVQYPRDVRRSMATLLDGGTIAAIVFSVLAVALLVVWILVGYTRSMLMSQLMKNPALLTALDKSVLVNLTWTPPPAPWQE